MKFDMNPSFVVGALLGVLTIGAICSIFTLLSVNTLFGTTFALSVENIASTTWLYIMFGSAMKGFAK
jgi:hypothetical protein